MQRGRGVATGAAYPREGGGTWERQFQLPCGALFVHFDVDAMNFPAAEVPHPRWLDAESASAPPRVFVTAPTCVGVVVTEFNAGGDPDGSHAERLVHGLVEAARRAGGVNGWVKKAVSAVRKSESTKSSLRE